MLRKGFDNFKGNGTDEIVTIVLEMGSFFALWMVFNSVKLQRSIDHQPLEDV
jgi:hypothetical protein